MKKVFFNLVYAIWYATLPKKKNNLGERVPVKKLERETLIDPDTNKVIDEDTYIERANPFRKVWIPWLPGTTEEPRQYERITEYFKLKGKIVSWDKDIRPDYWVLFRNKDGKIQATQWRDFDYLTYGDDYVAAFPTRERAEAYIPLVLDNMNL